MTTYNVSLADLRQDIAGIIPPDLVLRWNQRDRSLDRHDALLAPFRTRGTIVSVDSAGLSRMSQPYALPQVLSEGERFTLTISHVELRGVRMRV